MKLGVNLLGLVPSEMRGQERYIRNILNGLGAHPRAVGWDVFLFTNRENHSVWGNLPRSWSRVETPISGRGRVRRILYEQLILPREMDRRGVDVSFHPSYTAPLKRTQCRKVVTIHDTQFLHFPDDFRLFEKIGWHTLVPRAARGADAVVTVSGSAAEDISRGFGIAEDRIHVIHHGVSSFFAPGGSDRLTSAGGVLWEGGIPYCLSVGDTYPHKNFGLLLKAFSLLKSGGVCARLILVGRPRRAEKELAIIIRENRLEGTVSRVQDVEEQELRELYRCAEIFVLPSLYEGFGLPLVEAMACGVPVICHDGRTMREVCGSAARYVDCREPEGLARVLEEAIQDEPWRRQAAEAGVKRAGEFDWTRAVEEHIDLFEVLGGKRGSGPSGSGLR